MVLKDFFEKFKKGSLSTKQIVTMVILIAGFIVVLLFFSQLDFGEESKAQLCRNSVMQASNVPSVSSSSLQCTTKYVCITADGSCDEMVKPDETVEVSSKEEIFKELSEQKAQCWWMFGAGEVDYVGDDITKGNYCSICHQTYLDDSLSSIEGVEEKISKDELYDYMTSHNYSKSQTYAQFILGTNDIERFKSQLVKSSEQDIGDVSFGAMGIGKTQYNVMGITSDTSTIGWIVGGAVAAGSLAAVIATGGTVAPFVAGAVIGGVGAGSYSSYVDGPVIKAISLEGRGIDNKFMAPVFKGSTPGEFKALNCEKILTDSS
ncbi:MAG: hypothetical protein ABEI74_03130 [Candidatus Pacearchaeota archaeon]